MRVTIREDMSLAMADMVRRGGGASERAGGWLSGGPGAGSLRADQARLACPISPAASPPCTGWACSLVPSSPLQLVADIQDALAWLDTHFTFTNEQMDQARPLLERALSGSAVARVGRAQAHRRAQPCLPVVLHQPTSSPSLHHLQLTMRALNRKLSRLDSSIYRGPVDADKQTVRPC